MADPPEHAAQWQLVLVLWGCKYAVNEVNHLVRSIVRAATPLPERIILLTDRPRPGLDPAIRTQPIPDFFLAPDFRDSGCQTKLCLFDAGSVPDDIPAIYVDIDTVVLGNLARLVPLIRNRHGLAMLPSAVLPFGRLARSLHWLTGGRVYARGNSSIMVYHPAGCAHIAQRFRALFARHGHNGVRPMIADERFVSWAHQPHMRAIPQGLAVKFPTEFMLPWRWLILTRAALPWVRARWAGLIAVTLPGGEVKGAALLALPEGGELVDRKGRRLIWSDRALGPVRRRIADHYTALTHPRPTDPHPPDSKITPPPPRA